MLANLGNEPLRVLNNAFAATNGELMSLQSSKT